jgi:hypothetical protein
VKPKKKFGKKAVVEFFMWVSTHNLVLHGGEVVSL